MKKDHKLLSLNRISIVLTSILLIFVYLSFEWLFLVTKPSFMSSMNFMDKLGVLLTTFCFLSAIYLFGSFIVIGIDILLKNQLKKLFIIFHIIFIVFLTASLLLLLIDNFTYIVFQFGIVNSEGFFRVLYALFFVVLMFIIYKDITRLINNINHNLKKMNKRSKLLIFSIFLIIICIFGFIPVVKNLSIPSQGNSETSLNKTPNIFLFTVDGVNAENMSLYGYERKTTPFLESIAETSLVVENAFTNSGNTSGSIISIFTGKYPVDTKVLYPPDILLGNDAYQHLPGILKLNGYSSIQFSFTHYVDAYQLNVRNGFDVANGRSYQNNVISALDQNLPNNSGYFIYEVGNRLLERLLHIFFITKMANPLVEVSTPEYYDDWSKIDGVLNYLDQTTKPVFAHIHWMGPHGPSFYPREQVFSTGKDPEEQELWDVDFYDDSILEFDNALSFFMNELENRNLIDNSIIIIASDHGQNYVTDKRLPLLIHFPNDEFNQRFLSNAQNIDISPTILDYLGIEQPDWMAGNSLLNEISPNRQIFSVGVGNVEIEDGSMNQNSIKPPFYQFGYASVIVCDKFYKVNLSKFSIDENFIENYSGNCRPGELSNNEIYELMINFFNTYNYDTTSLMEKLQ